MRKQKDEKIERWRYREMHGQRGGDIEGQRERDIEIRVMEGRKEGRTETRRAERGREGEKKRETK